MSEILYKNNFENEEKKMEDMNIGLKKLYLKKKHNIKIIEDEVPILGINKLLNLFEENNLKIKQNHKINNIDENKFKIKLNESNKNNIIKINCSSSESLFSDSIKIKNDVKIDEVHPSENSFKLIKKENSNQSYNENQGNETNIKYNNNNSINSSFSFHFGNSEKSKFSINNIEFSDSIPQENPNSIFDNYDHQNSFLNDSITKMTTKMDTEDNLKNSFMIL